MSAKIFLPQISQFVSVPPRRMAHMPAQPIVSWTPAILLRAVWDWLIAETAEPEVMQALSKAKIDPRRS